MQQFELVTHPILLEEAISADPSIVVVLSLPFGPLGLNKYKLNADDWGPLRAIKARPYSFVFDTPVLSEYRMDDCISMCTLFLRLFAGIEDSEPSVVVGGSSPPAVSFEILEFANPPTTHLLPVINGEYLLVCKAERDYLNSCYGPGALNGSLKSLLDIHSLLGLRAITHDPLCWINMRIDGAIMWNGGCVIPSEDYNNQIPNILFTLRYMEVARRRGFRARVTNDTNSINSDGIGFVHREMRYGPVVFTYTKSLDMQPEDGEEFLQESAKRHSEPI